MNTSVSVVMPCYNAALYVRAAVESVLAQTWKDFELIVVDDGSTDGSKEALADITDPRLRIVQQENRGQCSACNRGFLEATGELIKFFDADDLMDEELLRRQVMRLDNRTDAIVVGEWQRFTSQPKSSDQFEPRRMYRDAAPLEWLVAEWSEARPMMQCGLFLIPRRILQERGLWDERLSLINDFEFFARILLGSSELLYSEGARIHYRSGLPNSLSRQKSRQAVESAFLSLMLGTQHLLDVENSARTRAACAAMLKDFEFTYYPAHPDLRVKVRHRVRELGGSTLSPDGPPGFQKLRRFIGWKLARRIQHVAEALELNSAGRNSYSLE